MDITLAADSARGFPVIIASGPITEDSLVELGDFVRVSCEQARIDGAIIDCKAIEGALSAESLYRATPEFAMAVGREIKVAYINPPESWRPDVDQFSRDVAYNRGSLLELFDSTDDAVHWLRDA